MIKVGYNYLFYCFYDVLSILKRRGTTHQEVAVTFFSVILSGWLFNFYLFIGLKSGKWLPMPTTLLVFVVMGLIYYFNKWYFFKEKRYKDIINYLRPRANRSICKIVAVGITLLTFFIFINISKLI